jgi:hypothetical protein
MSRRVIGKPSRRVKLASVFGGARKRSERTAIVKTELESALKSGGTYAAQTP